MTATETDFPQLSWHDCHIWGLEFRVGVEQDWTSDFVIRLDFITEWLCSLDGAAEFRVAPAELIFHGVTEPVISIPWPQSVYQVAISLPSIDRIEREPVANQRIFLDRPYHRWTIRLNHPAQGVVSFGAVAFTQQLIGEPLLTGRQHLTMAERQHAIQTRRA
jgi:hypothetical protein